MGVLTLTLIGSLIVGGGFWLLLGSPLNMSQSKPQNDALNLLAYVLGVAPILFVLIFFGIGGS